MMAHLIGGLLLISFSVFAQSVEPGIWQADSSLHVIGFELPASHEQECVSASEAKDIRKTITKELENIGCAYTKWVVKGHRLEVSLKCKRSGLDATGDLRGTVNAKNYDLTGDAEGTYQGIPTQATLVLKGKWIKSCMKK
jgi:hypothetical protein